MQNNQKYEYKQLEQYKEIIELKHIRIRTLLVNGIALVLAVILAFTTLKLNTGDNLPYIYMTAFLVFFAINILLYSFQSDLYNNLKIAMYFNTIALFSISISLIIVFQTPSIYTSLFLTYAIIFIYQDYKVMILSNFLIFISGFLLVLNYNVLDIPNTTTPQILLIIIFLFLFVVLLAISSYILIKRKMFFYNQLAEIKEAEIRNIDILDELKTRVNNKEMDVQDYYDSIYVFTEKLSKKLEIDNVFTRKIALLEDLNKLTMKQINEKYPEFTDDEIKDLRFLEFNVNNKLRNLAIKASQSKDITISKNEIFSESQFTSFNHFDDTQYVKIISFVVFYVLLKLDKPYMTEIEERKLKDILLNSKYFYSIDRKVLEIYLGNNKVFDTVVQDILKEGENNESTS